MSSNASVIDEKSLHLVDVEEQVEVKRPVKRLFTPLVSKYVPQTKLESERKPLPLFSTNIFSKIFLFWVFPLLNIGYKRTIEPSDLWYLDDSLKVDNAFLKFQENLDAILTKYREKNPDSESFPRFAIILAIFKLYKWEYSTAVVMKLISTAFEALTPLVTRYLISFAEEKRLVPDTPTGRGVGLCLGVSLMMIIIGFLQNQSLILSKFVGGNSRTILTKALLEKSFIASSETKHNFPSGKIISLISGDISRIDLGFSMLPFGLGFPIPLIIGIAILIVNIGVSALAGIAVYVLIMVSVSFPAKSLLNLRMKANVHTDERVSIMREILQSMKMIKFYSWENAYEASVREIRKNEVSYVYKVQNVLNYIFSLSFCAPSIVSMTAFLVLSAVKKDQDAARIFSSLSLFGLLSTQSINLPYTISFVMDAISGSDRITKYLKSSEQEFDLESFYNDSLIKDKDIAIKILHGDFEWETFDNEDEKDKVDPNKVEGDIELGLLNDGDTNEKTAGDFVLKDINLDIYKGEFLVITGVIGSGKSSLLSAITGFMKKTSGDVGVSGSALLCGAPWIQNATIKENILFGTQYDSDRYRNTIKACAFDSDIKELPAGDMTEIGERGVTLSGGQKARLSLARAVYTDKDIYLFDDILSAVDANVGKQITENCLLGVLSDKTRVIATHQLSLIKKADRIVFLNGDGTIDVGTEDELRARNLKFVSLMKHTTDAEDPEKDRTKDHIDAIDGQPESKKKQNGALYGNEERAINSIPLSVYKQYLNAGSNGWGFGMFVLLFALIVVGTFCYLFTNVWLSYWVDNHFKGMGKGTYMGIYVLLSVVTVFFTASEFILLGYVLVRASQVLNLQAVSKVLHTPMKFMDTTPVGRVINRFSKDTNTLDNEIVENIKIFIYMLSSIVGAIILAIAYIPWFAIAVPFFIILFVGVTNYYQATSREVKRLEAIVRSHIFNNLNEVMNGMNTIKAYNAEERFLDKNSLFSDKLNEVYIVVFVCQRWISLTLNALASVLVFLVTILAVTGQFKISAASVGLLTTYMMEMASNFAAILNVFTQIENQMNSVERICHYASSLEQESPYMISETTPDPSWPSAGSIEFKNVSFRYRENLPLILKRLTLHVDGGEKIGICGRTGAGKSSILTALYRLNELAGGEITIDGVDISKLGLHSLRSKLTIIPQDPTLFQGDIRKNLDPFNECTDDKLWDALRRSGLINGDDLDDIKLQTNDNYHKFHLESKVEDEGSNFSLGERQLVALARALVRQSKILILDEATSKFKDCTVLCIAHRLKTILNYDKILVLEKGEVEEFEEPATLYHKGGRFREMCESASITASDFE
ncbi:hypothetical protein WICANDRAFT_82082 [Wickerhamomyces anomalus NRRL Y-366-8]|uniref:Oligomycin resistance ATP-dependent permease YOR1 n=1 Tax=Wickerhamomyces anomalus (strain ATCC 58044 / CBS 1984 / NCYC 433 / NRRL Y-366-8) TaxID=683960 RepID=A0A1E3P967_WICAA|nr:uncharacterized protein WICANDRAFT_82082 [Wickerhamomyces anomalus NRRL Y-366-8]ODQ61918.1 hypothetical protein WICANDRAFT_82082 [Wickerhamomyces anomalus NRRL Y-366-8]